MSYINLNYKPKRTDLVAEFYVEPNRISLREASKRIAEESSIGTWTSIKTLNKEIIRSLQPSVFYINNKDRIIKIAYSGGLFEKGNMPSILSGVAGNIFGMKCVKNLRLEDIEFPKKIVSSFKGPRYGIKGVRKLLRVKNRPLVGTIVKPKLGLDPERHSKVAYEAWLGGCDIVKDDENLSNQNFNRFRERVRKTLKMRDKAEKETGERKVYMANVTAETKEMLKRAEYIKKNGGRYVMVDIITSGWSALQTLRDETKLVIHAHRAGHAMLTRNKKQGVSMLTVAKIARLIGVDQIHIGTVVGKMEGSKVEVLDIEKEIERNVVYENKTGHVLEQKWYNIKPSFAVASGGLHPGLVQRLMSIMGKNIIIQAGGGIHGHRYGTVAGAKAMRQAVDAVMEGYTVREYSRYYKELEIALKQWSK